MKKQRRKQSHENICTLAANTLKDWDTDSETNDTETEDESTKENEDEDDGMPRTAGRKGLKPKVTLTKRICTKLSLALLSWSLVRTQVLILQVTQHIAGFVLQECVIHTLLSRPCTTILRRGPKTRSGEKPGRCTVVADPLLWPSCKNDEM